MNKMSELYNSPAFAIFADLYSVYKNHKKKVLMFLVIEFLIHANALHHLAEIKSLWKALLFWE